MQPLDGDASLGDGLTDAGDGGIGIGGHQDQISAGLKGQHGSIRRAMAGCDGFHHQGVRHHQAVEAQRSPQQIGQHDA